MSHQPVPYSEVLEQAGFYHQGRPLGERVWSAEDLRPARLLGRQEAGVPEGDVRSLREHI